MKALVITPFSPEPSATTIYGAFRRLSVFLAAISDVATTIEIVFFGHSDELAARGGIEAVEASQSASLGCPVTVTLVPHAQRRETFWRHYGAGILSLFEQPDFHYYVGTAQVETVAQSLARRPDLVFVFRLAAMSAVLRSGYKPERLFLDLDDVEHKVKLRNTFKRPVWPGKLLYCLQVPAIIIAERLGAAASEQIFVCSKQDQKHLRWLGFGQKVAVVPNAIQIPDLAAPLGERSLLYLGYYSYHPNLEAAERLISRIWPLVRARVPDARLVIAGLHPEGIPSFARQPEGVTFTGFVEDLGQLYSHARVIACPITAGGGTRIKLIEAAAYGKAIVSTRIGAEGLDFVNGEQIILSDTDSGIADACSNLLIDDRACAAMGAAARARARELYDANAIRRRVAAMLRPVAKAAG